MLSFAASSCMLQVPWRGDDESLICFTVFLDLHHLDAIVLGMEEEFVCSMMCIRLSLATSASPVVTGLLLNIQLY